MGDATPDPVRLTVNPQIHVKFRGATLTSDAGLVLPRKLDGHPRPRTPIDRHLTDLRLIQEPKKGETVGPYRNFLLKAGALAVLMWAVLSGTAAHAALTADYQFKNTLASSAGTPPDLTNLGPGTSSFVTDTVDAVSHTVLQFPLGNGLSLFSTAGVIPSGIYTVVILFRIDTVTGYRKIVDFHNGTLDAGLYNLDSNLVFFPVAGGSGTPIGAGVYVQVVLTRDASGNVVGYVNGTQQFTFVDGTNLAVIDGSNTLRFLIDDTVQGTEDSAGAVARLRLYDTALSSSEVAALDRLPPPQTAPIPTLSEWGFLLLAGLLAASGFFIARRRGLDVAV